MSRNLDAPDRLCSQLRKQGLNMSIAERLQQPINLLKQWLLFPRDRNTLLKQQENQREATPDTIFFTATQHVCRVPYYCQE